MGRWADREDETRLPQGFIRVAYDADTQRYTFQDEDGNYYEGPEGATYGEMVPVPPPSPEEIARNNAELRRSNREAFRMLLPFALIMMVFLLLLFRFINMPTSHSKPHFECPDGGKVYYVQKGDSCWEIAMKYCENNLEELMSLNKDMNCDNLQTGDGICVSMRDLGS